jgi:hypothetical protein
MAGDGAKTAQKTSRPYNFQCSPVKRTGLIERSNRAANVANSK